MEKLSRTKKYADLREKIQHDREELIHTNELSTFKNKLNTIDSNHFEKAEDVSDTSHDPIHRRREEYFNPQESTDTLEVPQVHSEYLDDYINEVKEYNRQKGLLTVEDTQTNILSEIRNPENKVIRPFGEIDLNQNHNLGSFKRIDVDETMGKDYQESNSLTEDTVQIPFMSNEELNNTISLEIKNLLNQGNVEYQKQEEPEPQEEVPFTFNRSKESEALLNETVQMVVDPSLRKETPVEHEEKETKVSTEDFYKRKTIEVEESDEFEDDYEGNSRIINFVLVLLILIFIVVLAFVGYWILLQKGII